MADPDVVLLEGWWASGLYGSRGLFEVFNRRPASLEGARCVTVRFDSFPDSIPLVVNLVDAPDPLPARWRRRGHDALRLLLQFDGCSSVRVRGRLEGGGCPVDVRSSDEGFHVRLKDDRLDMEFLAKYGAISLMKPFRRGEDLGRQGDQLF